MGEQFQIDQILFPFRLVQAELDLEGVLQGLSGVRNPGEVGDRGPRQDTEKEEVDRDGHEHGGHGEDRPLDDVVGAPHLPSRPLDPSSRAR